jgi:hypothetical protein
VATGAPISLVIVSTPLLLEQFVKKQNSTSVTDSPQTPATSTANPVRERRPFVAPTVQKVGGLKDLTQEFGGST